MTAETDPITITLQWPPAALFPNARHRVHWSKTLGPKSRYRDYAFWMARQAIGTRRFEVQPKVEVQFHPPNAIARDDDGMIGAFKAARDGVAKAIGHDDRLWRPTYSFHEPCRPSGKVVVVLTAEVAP